MFSRRVLGVVLASSIIVALAAGCGRTSPSVTEEPRALEGASHSSETARRGGTLIVGLAATSIATLDPAAYSDRTTETVLRNIYDGLMTRTVDNEVIPELAHSYRWVDHKTVEFELKRGVIFQNGEPLAADDVVFTFERILRQSIGAPRRSFVQEVERVEAVNDYTVRFHLKAPWPVFLQMLTHNQIVPRDLVTWQGSVRFAGHPVGAGPFRYAEGELNDQIVLQRFADYYGGADGLPPVGPPYLDRVIFRMMPEARQRVDALLAGEVHIIQSVPAAMVSQISGNPDITVKTSMGTRPKFMDLNVTRPPFDDVRVRRAVNYAVDAQQILNDIEGGFGVLMSGPLSPANLYFDPGLPRYEHDPKQAEELLADAGLGFSDISFVIDAYGPYLELAQAVAQQLSGLGMDVSVMSWDYEEIRPLLLNCERQAFLRDWGDSAFDPVGYAEAKWQTQLEGTPEGRGNFSCYANPRVDQLIEAGGAEPEPEKRRELYNEMQRIIHSDAPALFLYVPQEIEAASSKVHNWKPSPDSRINLHDVWLEE